MGCVGTLPELWISACAPSGNDRQEIIGANDAISVHIGRAIRSPPISDDPQEVVSSYAAVALNICGAWFWVDTVDAAGNELCAFNMPATVFIRKVIDAIECKC